MLETFIAHGVYKLFEDEGIFLCESVSSTIVGKLTYFKKISTNTYERTSTTYFLNDYVYGSVKQIFLQRERYEMIGVLGNNCVISEDKNLILVC